MNTEQQLLECEETLRSVEAEYAAFRERMLMPLNLREHGSIESLSWDDLLGVANRNLTLALDAVSALEGIAHHDTGRAGEIAQEWLVKQGIWTKPLSGNAR